MAVGGGIKVFDPFYVYKTLRANEREMAKNTWEKIRIDWYKKDGPLNVTHFIAYAHH